MIYQLEKNIKKIKRKIMNPTIKKSNRTKAISIIPSPFKFG